MRTNPTLILNQFDFVYEYLLVYIIEIFSKYGEEKYSRSIANGIVKARENKKIETTLELVEIIKNNVPEKYKRNSHPARKVFQAIRIEVNKELDVFEKALNDAIELLNPTGRICVITFHSLEDRICKNKFKKLSEVDKMVKGLPIIPDEYKPVLKIIGKYKPSKKELEENNRSRSARLRVIERVR